MYIPKSFAETDCAVLHQFMRDYNFATLVTQHDSQLVASHIPFLLDTQRGEYGTLIAHLARANPQWKHFEMGRESLVMFQGPHAYVSPSWYETHPSVPTWNYVAVHAYGIAHIIDDQALLYTMLESLVQNHEGHRHPSWEMQLPEDYLDKMMKSIVGFEIPITRLEGKYKLSQNRSAVDQENVIAQLGASEHALETSTAALMDARRTSS
jgi:transcriptional regulator